VLLKEFLDGRHVLSLAVFDCGGWIESHRRPHHNVNGLPHAKGPRHDGSRKGEKFGQGRLQAKGRRSRWKGARAKDAIFAKPEAGDGDGLGFEGQSEKALASNEFECAGLGVQGLGGAARDEDNAAAAAASTGARGRRQCGGCWLLLLRLQDALENGLVGPDEAQEGQPFAKQGNGKTKIERDTVAANAGKDAIEIAPVGIERRVAAHANDTVRLVQEQVTFVGVQIGRFHQVHGKVVRDPAKGRKAAEARRQGVAVASEPAVSLATCRRAIQKTNGQIQQQRIAKGHGKHVPHHQETRQVRGETKEHTVHWRHDDAIQKEARVAEPVCDGLHRVMVL